MIIRSANSPVCRPKSKHKFSWRILNIFLACACVVFGVAYLVSMNDLTVKGFALKDLKSRSRMLSEENQELQAKSLTLQSYAAISPRLRELNMVAVEDVAYLSPKSPVVAKK